MSILDELDGMEFPRTAFRPDPIAVVRHDPLETAGRLLAARTSREVIAIDWPDLSTGRDCVELNGISTLVAAPGAVTRTMLMRFSRSGIALMTARDQPSFVRLIGRMARPIAWSHIHISGMLSSDADETEVPELAQMSPMIAAAKQRLGLLSIRGHGRDCLVHFADGVICGRTELTEGRQELGTIDVPSCLGPTGICRRSDLRWNKLLRISDLNSHVIMLDSCRPLKVDYNGAPSPWSLPLAALDGTAVAYLSSPWMRIGAAWSCELLRAELAAGRSLGEAVSIANAAIEWDTSAFGALNLLGDGGYVPFGQQDSRREPLVPLEGDTMALVTHGRSVVHISHPKLDGDAYVGTSGAARAVRLSTDESVLFSDGSDVLEDNLALHIESQSSMRRIAVASGVISRLLRSSELGFAPLGDVCHKLLGRAREVADEFDRRCDAAAEDLAVALGRLEQSAYDQEIWAVDYLTGKTARSFYTYSSHWPKPRFQGPPVMVGCCPHCHDGSVWAFPVWCGVWQVELEVGECSNCGEIWSGDAALGRTVSAEVPREVVVGSSFEVAIRFSGLSQARRSATIGVTVANEDRFGGNLHKTATVEVGEGGHFEFRIMGSFDPFETPNIDRQFVVVFICHEGRIVSVRRPVWLAK